jgi:hypothetical protein
MVATVQLRSMRGAEDIARWRGKRLKAAELFLVADGGDVDIFKPSGEPLLLVRRGVFPDSLRDPAFAAFEKAARDYLSMNRASYGGLTSVRKPGTNTTQTVDEHGNNAWVQSAVVGFMDPQGGRFPYCRHTSFVAKEVVHWPQAMQAARVAGDAFKEWLPDRYAAQAKEAARSHPTWIIPGTPFSTITANRNVIGAIHRDAGDYPEGFGVITCHRKGSYRGGVLGFAQFGVGVDLRDGDLILFDPHAWHGVTEMFDKSEDAVRVTAVYYLRAKMSACKSPEEEFSKARANKDAKVIA